MADVLCEGTVSVKQQIFEFHQYHPSLPSEETPRLKGRDVGSLNGTPIKVSATWAQLREGQSMKSDSPVLLFT